MKDITKQFLKQIVVLVLTKLSIAVLKKYQPKIIAVTGSVGKTTTKDAIYTAIYKYKKTRKSEKSFNSEIGVPLTILGCKNAWSNPFLWIENIFVGLKLVLFKNDYPEWLVLEVGADRPGDIENISKWLTPNIAVITRLPNIPVHIEYFSSVEEISKEKLFLARSLAKDGVVVVNSDDETLERLVKELNVPTITYGADLNSDVTITDITTVYSKTDNLVFPSGINFNLNIKDQKILINIDNVIGNHVALNLGASLAIAKYLNLNIDDVAKGLSMFINPLGRMNLIKGIKQTLIIDDSYNSSPVAVEEGLTTMANLKISGRKIIVLGDMLELGIFSTEEHKKIGEKVANVGDILITVGVRARGFAEGAMNAGMSEKNIFQYENSQEAGKEVQNMLSSGDLIFVKGSQGVRMEKFVEEIMLEPDRKADLLVRQSKEWMKK